MYNEDLFYLGMGSFFLLSIVFWLIVLAFRIIVLWKTFQKAGKNGWEAIIPFYNMWTLFEISGYPGYMIFFALIPYVGIIILFVFRILAGISLAKKFDKSEVFGVFLLAILPEIGFGILAFGKAKYDPSKGTSKNGYNAVRIEDEDDEEVKFCKYCGQKNKIDEKKCKKCNKEL